MNNLTIPQSENLPQQFIVNSNHNSFFQHLEYKLLTQSQKLASFIGKSVIRQNDSNEINNMFRINQKGKKQKPLAQGYNKLLKYTYSYNNLNFKTQSFNINKIRQICNKLKKSKFTRQQRKRSVEIIQSLQKIIKQQNIAINLKGTTQSKPRLNLNNSILRNCKANLFKKQVICRKDTASTLSFPSFKILDDHLHQPIHSSLKLKDFIIIKHLSQNKFGSVYLVKHKMTNFICSLKKINNFLDCKDEILINRRIQQIKIQSFLDHPNIIQLYTIFIEDRDLYLLMQTCFGGDLYDNLKVKGKIDEDEIRSIVKQICYAIQYMHDNDILHRDIKPQNILFHENIAKIGDFGCSIFSPLLRDTVCGTPLYSSPEIVQKQNYDSKVDIWNIGVLTYELLYGKPPFDIRSLQDLEQIVSSNIQFSKTKPATLQIKDFILKCLQKNPKERSTVIKLLKHEFLSPQN